MKRKEKILLVYNFKKARGVVFERMLLYIGNTHLERFFAKGYLDDIAYLDIVRCFGVSSVDFDVIRVAGIVRDRSAFDYSGNLKILIKSHLFTFYQKNRDAV